MPEETVAEIEEQVPVKKQEHGADQTTISEYLESLLVTVILALFGTSFIVQAFKIPSASMEGTLLIGDHLLVNKFIFGGTEAWYEKLLSYRQLRRGDIIVFKYPFAEHQHYVKRVIGLPGDHLKLVDQQMFINGKILPEPYVVHDSSAPYDPLNYNFPTPISHFMTSAKKPEVTNWLSHEMRRYVHGDEIVVPPGKYFAMGDNRDLSEDSRYWGFVDRDAIMGRPFLIYWSVDARSADYSGESNYWSRLVGVFETMVHLPSRTRWRRQVHHRLEDAHQSGPVVALSAVVGAPRVHRPVNQKRPPHDGVTIHKSPIAAVLTEIAIVPHGEIFSRRHDDFISMHVPPHLVRQPVGHFRLLGRSHEMANGRREVVVQRIIRGTGIVHDIGLWQDFPVYEHLLVHQLQMISGQTDHSFYIMLMFGERILENDNVAASQLAVRQQ